MNTEQIIEKFKKASVIIKVSDCNNSHKDMIVTIHPDYGISYFTSYHTAYLFFSNRNLI